MFTASGKPRPPSLLDLPIQEPPTKMRKDETQNMDINDQNNAFMDQQDEIPGHFVCFQVTQGFFSLHFLFQMSTVLSA